jgi:hypothetical protein
LQEAFTLVATNAASFYGDLVAQPLRQLYQKYEFREGHHWFNWDVDDELAERPFNIKYPSEIRDGELTHDEFNALIAEYENCATSLYGGLTVCRPALDAYDQFAKWSSNIYKALCLSDAEWEGEAMGALLLPESFSQNRMYLSGIVKSYEIALDRLDSGYQKLSRMLTVKLGEPGMLSRGSENQPPYGKEPAWKKGK